MRRMSRMRDRVDLTSLVAGAAIAVFGALILLQEEDDRPRGRVVPGDRRRRDRRVLLASGMGARRG